MAKLVAAYGSSHSAMLQAEKANWLALFDHVDRKVPLLARDGSPSSWEAQLAAAAPRAGSLMAAAAIAQRFDATMQAIDRLEADIAATPLDALIVVGDDQREIFKDDLRPAIGIYYGAAIRNAAAPGPAPAGDWYRAAQYRRMEEAGDVEYPCHDALALHLVEGLCARGFDITAVKDLGGRGEGHAFSFFHKRYLGRSTARMVPIFLNTYYPPNQPTPARCWELGRALGELVAAFPGELRVGVAASGGLSHYYVDEELDRAVIGALQRKDERFLAGLEPRLLQSGTSEIRNWICTAAAARPLALAWHSYVPGYRSSALTGVGLCFARWA